MSSGPLIASLSDADLRRFLSRVDREVFRLGTREHLISVRILDEAKAQGASLQAFGDSLVSALATDRDTWQALRRVFDAEFAPPTVPLPSRWPRALAFGLSLLVSLALAAFGLRGLLPSSSTDLGLPWPPDAGTQAGSVDLGGPDLPPTPPNLGDLGCYKEPLVEVDAGAPRTITEQVPVPVVTPPLSGLFGLALLTLLVCALGLILLRWRSYLRPRLADWLEKQQAEASVRKQREEAQRSECRAQLQQLLRDAIERGEPTRPHYHIDLQPPFADELVEDSATLLGRAFFAQPGHELDIDATLAKTIEHAGPPQPVFAPRREVRELLVCYDDTTTFPYLPGFLRLVLRWQRLGVRLRVYRFSRHPSTLMPVSLQPSGTNLAGRARAIELTELLRQHEGASLLLFANRLLLQTQQRELDWPERMRPAAVSVWLDPDPRLDAEREDDDRTDLDSLPRRLARFPFTADGLLAAARKIGSPAEVGSPPPWSPPLPLSDPYMARWVDLWLGLAALVPDAAVDQIEAVRQKLLSEPLPDPRSVGRLMQRLRELLGPTFNPGKRTIELSETLRTQFKQKLKEQAPELYLRGGELLEQTLAAEPKLAAGETPGYLHHITRFRRATYQAEQALMRGMPIDPYFDALRGTPMHEAAEKEKALLRALQEGPGNEEQRWETPDSPPLPPSPGQVWRMATPLIAQSVMVAICLSLLLPAFGRLSETWPQATVLVTTTMPSATPARPDERVICPHRPKLTPDPAPAPPPTPALKPKPATVAVKRPDTVPVPSLVRAAPDPRPVVATVPSDLGADAAPPDPASSANQGGVGLRPKMLPIRAGRFPMGSADSAYEDERPVREVVIQTAFEMSETEVTQAQYQAVMGRNPSYHSRDREAADYPVENVSWFDAVEYCNALSQREGRTACYQVQDHNVTWPKACNGYRLPTEAEWEYAARAGKPTEYAGANDVKEVAWIGRNSGGRPHRVGTRNANAWGLHDMSGNVWEWVWDWHADSYTGAATTDPRGPSDGAYRVLRGGAFLFGAVDARVAYRYRFGPTYRDGDAGFRLARSYP
jgi:formylglycine-generating enzyme required for sulfatase activity